MLSLAAFQVLADRKLTDRAQRLFLRLIVEYDLRRFRIVAPHLRAYYGIHPERGIEDMRRLVQLGLLTEGPPELIAGRKKWVRTYRISPQFLLSHEEVEEQVREDRAQWEREQLLEPGSGAPSMPVSGADDSMCSTGR